MTRSLWYDADGNPVTMRQAEVLLASRDRIVAQSTIGDLWVSTVHTVIDYSLCRHAVPVIFETAVFHRGGDWVDGWRSCTRHAALAIHDQVCAAIRDGAELGSVLTERRF